ncbi:MAG: type III-A CRISPR-associated RAMP protein Csm5, partial [Acholeplasmatales bacterium]|nr:type III-A CRISPR-associated RAMP protein Csm5 [Acholeplasmatales bacterium]
MKKYKLVLETLSNLHIGSGNILQSFDYFYDKEKFNVVDQDKLVDLLISNNRVNDFVREVAQGTTNSSRELSPTLSKFNIDKNNIIKYSLDGHIITDKDINRATRARLKPIEEFIKDEEGNPYIPGSSIKGFISNILGIDIKAKNPKMFFSVSDSKPLSIDLLYVSTPVHFNIRNLVVSEWNQMNYVEFLRRGATIEFTIIDYKCTGNFTDDINSKVKMLNKKYNNNFIDKFGIGLNDIYNDDYKNRFMFFSDNESYFRIGKYTNFLLKTKHISESNTKDGLYNAVKDKVKFMNFKNAKSGNLPLDIS